MSRSNLNKMKNASHYHKEVSELNSFTLSKVMELLVIPKEDIVAFLDEYMVTASSTVREVREAVSDWKDENVVAESNVSDTDIDTDTDTDTNTDTDIETNNKEDCSTSNSCEDTMSQIERMVDTLEMEELIALMEYIEKRL